MQPAPPPNTESRGLYLAALAVLFFSTSPIFTRWAAESLSAYEISAGRMLSAGVLVLAIALVRKEALMQAAWPGRSVEESNLTVQVAALRKLLGTQPNGQEWIITSPRVGSRRRRADVAPSFSTVRLWAVRNFILQCRGRPSALCGRNPDSL